VVEELGGNAIRYGHAQSIRMDVVLAPAVVRLSIVDDGRPFDPTRHPEPTRARSLAEASVGGRGISLVRRFVRTMRYERDAGHNRLEIEIARALPD
jgi:anti-sigma regulatory factor (Ser/Thr protein kinase)